MVERVVGKGILKAPDWYETITRYCEQNDIDLKDPRAQRVITEMQELSNITVYPNLIGALAVKAIHDVFGPTTQTEQNPQDTNQPANSSN